LVEYVQVDVRSVRFVDRGKSIRKHIQLATLEPKAFNENLLIL